MNDKYVQELQKSIKSSRDQLITLEQSLTASEAASQLALYLAHGHVSRNRLNQWKVEGYSAEANRLNKQATAVVNLATKTAAAANNSLEESKKAISNVATAASNMQLSANAITHLASDVAGVLAVASSVNFDSDIYDKVKEANELTQQAARCAEKVSMTSLDSTVTASQSAAEDVLKDAEATLTTLTDFQTQTSANFATESEKVVEANTQTTESIQVQNKALEQYDITRSRDKAIKDTLMRQNQVSNHDLKLFDPVLDSDQPATQNVGKNLKMSFRKFIDESIIQEYRLMLVPQDEAPAFDLPTAKAVKKSENGRLSYIPVAKDTDHKNDNGKPPFITDCKKILASSEEGWEDQRIALKYYDVNLEFIEGEWKVLQKESKGKAEKAKETLVKVGDFSGRAIKHGTPYVAFIYVVYTRDFQSSANNTMGFLSTASRWFTPKFKLPEVEVDPERGFKVAYPHSARNLAVQFTAEKYDEKTNPVEYRAVFVNDQNLSKSQTSKKANWPQAAVIKKRLEAANQRYELKALLENWHKNNARDNQELAKCLEIFPEYLNLITEGRSAAIAKVNEAISKELEPIQKLMKADKPNQGEVAAAAVLLFLADHMDSGKSNEGAAEAINEVFTWSLPILGDEKEKLYERILKALPKKRSEARKEFLRDFNKQEGDDEEQYINKPQFPFNQEVMSLLTPNEYVLGKDEILEKVELGPDLVNSLKKVCSKVYKNERVQQCLKELDDKKDKVEAFEKWVVREYVTWYNFFGNVLPFAELRKCYLQLFHYILSPDSGIIKPEIDREMPTDTEWVAKPSLFPTSNYGNLLVENPLSDEVINQLIDIIKDLTIHGIVNNKCGEIKEASLNSLDDNVRDSLKVEHPIRYQVIILSAYKGPFKDRNKYIESHSVYSEPIIELFPQA